MLHIILLILKILGFLILVLAGLMLVAVITVLFAPAGYRFDLTAEEFGKSILGKLCFCTLLYLSLPSNGRENLQQRGTFRRPDHRGAEAPLYKETIKTKKI